MGLLDWGLFEAGLLFAVKRIPRLQLLPPAPAHIDEVVAGAFSGRQLRAEMSCASEVTNVVPPPTGGWGRIHFSTGWNRVQRSARLETVAKENSPPQTTGAAREGPRPTFYTLLIILALLLATTPFLLTLTDFFTRLIMGVGAYRVIQDWVVPYELRIMTFLLNLVGITAAAGKSFVELELAGKREVIYLAWNCIGWQSLALLGISFVSGFAGNHTLLSKFEAFLIGFLGTYLINIFRITFVVAVYHFVGRTSFGIVFHDYFSNLLFIGWLIFFWAFAYGYVLEPKQALGDVSQDRGSDSRPA